MNSCTNIKKNNNNNNYKRYFSSYQIHENKNSDIKMGNSLGRKFKESNKGGYGPNPPSNDDRSEVSDDKMDDNLNISKIEKENKLFTIATQNVRGFSDQAKQLEWVRACMEEDIDIIGLTETKLTQSSCKSVSTTINSLKFEESETTYKSWWSTSEKSKGSGVGILIKSNLAKHVYKIEYWKGYAMCLDLIFKHGKKMRLIVIYYPSNPQKRKIRSKLTKWCEDRIIKMLDPNFYQIVMGDFNAVMNPKVDRLSINRARTVNEQPESKLLKLMESSNLIDSYRLCNEDTVGFTWASLSDDRIKSRLDYIWISSNFLNFLIKSEVSFRIEACSDHKRVLTHLDRSFLPGNNSRRNILKNHHTIYTNKIINDKHWLKFSEKVEEELLLHKDNFDLETTDQQWITIKRALRVSASKCLPKKKVSTNHRNTNTFISPNDKNHQILSEYRKLFNRGRSFFLHRNHNNNDRNLECNIIDAWEKIKTSGDDEMPDIPWNKSIESVKIWLSYVKAKYHSFRKVCTKIIEKKKQLEIKKAIEKRLNDFKDNQKAMINSLLNREKRNIITDSVIAEENGKQSILVNPQEVKSHVAQSFENWTKKRITDFNNIDRNWNNIYKPQKTIESYWYDDMLVPFTIGEVQATINSLNNNSAPGASGIPYFFLKHMKESSLDFLVSLFNKIIDTSVTPQEWSIGKLFPIPKPNDWQKDINKTRPITLLETCRKIFTKIITKRLSKVMIDNPILNANNWAALPGGRTHDPINILNNVMEEARELKKELWLFFQDISKAYDSMSGIAVQKAMERIKIPKKIINIINCLLENRSNRVITFHGLTEPYTVHDGIDQGDSISPLLWRIFYDPLLDAVNKSNLGYVMSTNGNKPEESELSNHLTQRIYATVYMDDTVWLADNKVNLQKILNITQEFCKLVDININPMKSQVIHVNPKKTDRLSTVSMNGQDITPVGKHTPVRYLGVWLTQSGKKSFQKNLILDKVLNVIKTINWKKTTDKQVRYIINQVLFPQIEYLLSDMMISKSLCVKINSKILSFFKHKAGFAKIAINSLFFMSDGYKIFNIKDRQLQLHTCNWVQRINANNLVGTSTRIRLQQFQNEAWQTESVLTNPVIVKIKSGHNLTGDILEHLKENDFTFPTTDTNGNMIVLPSGGACPIIDYVETDWYMENRSGLRHKQIFFLDQLFNLDFSSLLEWPHFLTLNNCKAMGRIPKWFNELHELLNMNNCQEIIEFLKMVHNNINPFFDLTRPNDLKQGAWYSQTLHHNLVFGKEIKPRLRDNVTEDQVLVQHYLQLGKNLEPTSVLLPCDKCPLNTHNQNDNNRCLMIFEKDEVLLTPVKKSSVSTSNTLPKKIKPRIRIPLKDLEKIHEFAAEQREQSDEVIDMTLSPPASPNEDNRIEESESYSNDK
jgi:exonuclease III